MIRAVLHSILFAGVAPLCLMVPRVALATDYYWDTNGASSGIGSVGGGAASWLSSNWATGSTGTLPTGSWPNSNPNSDRAVFQGTAGTVNISTDVNVNSLSLLTRDYVIASTGGVLNLSGSAPVVNVSPPSLINGAQQTVRVSVPIIGTGGFTLTGNGQADGLKFLQLENANSSMPNAFSGTLTIAAGGALRLGGGAGNEQIPDDVDMLVAGVIDFITSGGASDGKQEKVRDVTVTGAIANFSIGNESDFIVNSITATDTTGSGIALNGNNGSSTGSHDPGTLRITGWHDGSGKLNLHDGLVRLNTTGGTSAVGSRVILSGDIESSGESSVTNVNGGGSNVEANTFTNRAFDFAGTDHTVNVSDGTLTFTSRSVSHPLELTTTEPGGAVVTKTGAGIWRLENAVQTDFEGAIKIEDGELSLANPALASAVDVYLKSGTKLTLGYNGTDEIHSLFINDVSLPMGKWGRTGNAAADFTTDLIMGDGLLQVNSYVPPALVGDFNNDETVDAADYTVWRDNFGGTVFLPNDQTPGMVTSEDYDDWKVNFGMTTPDSNKGVITTSVPEAQSVLLILTAFLVAAANLREMRSDDTVI